jgi:hypothetical protein
MSLSHILKTNNGYLSANFFFFCGRKKYLWAVFDSNLRLLNVADGGENTAETCICDVTSLFFFFLTFSFNDAN